MTCDKASERVCLRIYRYVTRVDSMIVLYVLKVSGWCLHLVSASLTVETDPQNLCSDVLNFQKGLIILLGSKRINYIAWTSVMKELIATTSKI